ncbi:TVP38/TMEM64 family protein [archaeon]|jgi:uncharacterized membrane protein YdjX (TVP38/TMEM64 family)|nr:TVP38/TMEM64 family protein [archaeon]MBT3577519.1 TVP38/TMEM64 family protein [archaeon]MBT6819934.1 TVP38/TMEM64 family protein [archaeon]MBT6955858.1 TVP38/TMEM64 family protein [archaeon]MBT7025490.1 TVP38/TMEM64 family protein [archaeon]
MKKSLIKKLMGIAIVLLIALAIYYLRDLPSHQEKIISTIQSWGIWGPLILIAALIIQGVISIFPSAILVFVASIIYGMVLGPIYSLIGLTLGAISTFLIAKKYGDDIEGQWISKKKVKHFDRIFEKNGTKMASIGRWFFIFPTDVISFVSGTSKMKLSKFIIASLIGFIPTTIIISFLGTKISTDMINLRNLSILGVIVLIAIVIHAYHHKISVKLHKLFLNKK